MAWAYMGPGLLKWDPNDVRFSAGDDIKAYTFYSDRVTTPQALMASSDPTLVTSYNLVLAGATTIAASMAGVMAATLAF